MSMLTVDRDLPMGRDTVAAVILAAGQGSRLQGGTDLVPKCLVEVAGQSMLSRMLYELENLNVDQIVIAVGYLREKIKDHVAKFHPSLPVTFVENIHYHETGSAKSLHLGLMAVPHYRHVLIIEADVVLEEGLCESVLRHCKKDIDAATLLARYSPDLSGTFALVFNNHVLSWCHESVRKSNFLLEKSYKTVNITLIKRFGPFTKFMKILEHTLHSEGENVPLEFVMEHSIQQGMKIAAVRVTGQRWYEIDTPRDLEIANRMFKELTAWSASQGENR